ncbi:hypothetical protein [Neobacillus jeddahensis]|nr:hypothetical protein [Neobacillus jeddahensis]
MNLLNIINIKFEDFNSGTHYALFNGSQIKYLIDKNDKNFYKNLLVNQNSYSFKHKLFKIIIKCMPVNLIRFLPNVKCCSIEINENLKTNIKENLNKANKISNYILGTKGPHQKIVIQIITESGEKIYIKAGNENVKELLLMESYVYGYLKGLGCIFSTPNLLFTEINEDISLNALDEVVGEEAPLEFNNDIFTLYNDISKINLNNLRLENLEIEFEFSHGDFAPWNIKRNKGKYIIYDWEYAGIRFRGYDIIHYVTQVENLIRKSSLELSIRKGVQVAKQYVPYLVNFEDQYLRNLYIVERNKTYMVNDNEDK